MCALSQDTARAANQPKCTAMGFGRDNARQCYQRDGYVNASRGSESKQCDMCTESSSPLRAVVPVVRLLSEVVLHDVGANRGRTFQTTLLAWQNISLSGNHDFEFLDFCISWNLQFGRKTVTSRTEQCARKRVFLPRATFREQAVCDHTCEAAPDHPRHRQRMEQGRTAARQRMEQEWAARPSACRSVQSREEEWAARLSACRSAQSMEEEWAARPQRLQVSAK